jgi:tRNA (guanine37-N1)-methyltransferase
VPEVLIGGNHAEVAKWRKAAALKKTRRNRPDLLLRG